MTRLPRSAALALLLALASTPAGADKPSSQPYDSNHPGLVRAKAIERTKPRNPHEAVLAGGPEASVLDSSIPGVGFEEAAVKAVLQWRYQPARRQGEPVALWMGVMVTFRQE